MMGSYKEIKNPGDHNEICGEAEVLIDVSFPMQDLLLYDDMGENVKGGFRSIGLSFIGSAICHLLLAFFIIFIAGRHFDSRKIPSAINVSLVSMPGSLSGYDSLNNKNQKAQSEIAKIEKPTNITSETKSKIPEPVREKIQIIKSFQKKTYKTGKVIETEKKEIKESETTLLSEKSALIGAGSGSANRNKAATENGIGVGNGKGTGTATGVYDSENIDRPITPLVRTPPIYPMHARRLGIEGWVKIKLLVSEKGGVENVEVIDSQPTNIFEKSVLQGVVLWRFLPPTVNGTPVKVLLKTTIRFKLEDIN